MNTILPHFRIDADALWRSMPGAGAVSLSDSLFEEMAKSLRQKFSQAVGFYDWPVERPADLVEQIQATAQELRKNFDGAVIFGIGGSYLGPITVVEALKPNDVSDFPLYWLSNADAPEIRRIERTVQGKRFAAIVISKSGGTVETLSAFFHLSALFDPKGIVVITDPEKGELRRLATAQKWKSFEVPPRLGGRFSVLSAVGLLPTALAGLDPRALLEGAAKMRQALEITPPAKNPAYRLGAGFYMWDVNFQHNVQVFMPYEKRLKNFADWWVQLFGESLGKRLSKDNSQAVGFTPVSAVGTTDQHSLLQLLKEGPSDKVVGFLSVHQKEKPLSVKRPGFEVKGFDYLFQHTFDTITHSACLATEQSLNNSGVPTWRIEFHTLDEGTLGSLFFFFETACAFAGELYGVDAFDQPGVEETKNLLKASLS